MCMLTFISCLLFYFWAIQPNPLTQKQRNKRFFSKSICWVDWISLPNVHIFFKCIWCCCSIDSGVCNQRDNYYSIVGRNKSGRSSSRGRAMEVMAWTTSVTLQLPKVFVAQWLPYQTNISHIIRYLTEVYSFMCLKNFLTLVIKNIDLSSSLKLFCDLLGINIKYSNFWPTHIIFNLSQIYNCQLVPPTSCLNIYATVPRCFGMAANPTMNTEGLFLTSWGWDSKNPFFFFFFKLDL